MKRLALVPLLLAAIVSAPAKQAASAAGPPPEVTIENVRIGFGGNDGPNGGQYKSGTWTPVVIDLMAGPADFEGIVEVIAPDDSNTPTTIRRAVAIKARELGTVTLFARPGSRGGDMGIRVVANRRVKATWTGGSVTALGAETALVLTAGSPQGVGDLTKLAKYTAVQNSNTPVFIAPIRPRDGFPGRWYGFDAADAVVVDTSDPATMTRLREAKGLIDWVRQGGHLIISVGQSWQAVKDSALAELLPGVPSGRVELADPGLIEQFAGSGGQPLIPAGSKEKLQVTKFVDWESRGGVVLAASSATPLILRGPYGFGRVTMIGLDVDRKPFASWEEKKSFWDKALDLRGRGADLVNGNVQVNPYGRYGMGDLSASLHDSLERFPGVRLVPFGWVAFFVFLYILLIGPGDYLFLRKVVKRMEMTWITFPAIVIVISGLAYAAAYYFKGTELRINKVDVVDVDQPNRLVRGRTWLTLFSPQNRDYTVGIAPLAPDAEPPANPVDNAAARTVNVETIMSWFGAPENPYGGGGGLSFSGGYDYAPMSEPEELTGVRVPIWSTKSFSGRWSGGLANPLLEADLTPDGPDRVRGTVTNVSRRPMKNATLFFGRFVYTLNDVAPGATVNLGEPQALPGYMEGVTRTIQQRAGIPYYGARPVAQVDDSTAEGERPDILRAMMFHSGLGAKGSSMPNYAYRSLDLTDQLDLRRPMLVAEVQGPATRLRLAGNGSAPKMVQTTLVRVILPLKAEAATPKP